MSPQPSKVARISPEDSTAFGDALVFGNDPASSLVIPKPIMARLWAQVNDGTRKLSRGGLEVGGLLVGPRTDSGAVEVEEIVPMPIEYRHGPSYQTSSADLAKIGPAVEAVHDDPSKIVVGFYRSRTRGNENLRESDHEILNAIEGTHPSFDTNFRCCFILAPSSEFAASAWVAVRNDAGWSELPLYSMILNPLSIVGSAPTGALQHVSRNTSHEEPPIQASPASTHSSTIDEPTKPHIAVSKSPARPPAQPISEHRQHQETGTHRTQQNRLAPVRVVRPVPVWIYGIAALIICSLGIVAYRWTFKKQPEPVQSVHAAAGAPRVRLGFSATLESPVWKLSWDRAAMDELNPVGAVLSIEDGGSTQQVPLAPADLASGIIFYTPQSADLSFSLRVDRGGAPVEEHVRVLGGPKVAQKTTDRAPLTSSGRASAQPKSASSSVLEKAAPSATPVASIPAAADQNSTVAGTTAPKETPAAPVTQPLTVALAVPVPPAIEIPRPAAPPVAPPVSQPVNQPPTSPVSQPGNQSTTQPANPPVAPSAPSRTETASVVTPTSGLPASTVPAPIPTPAVPSPSKTNYVGPRPIQQVLPPMASTIPAGISQVQVMVEIDTRGKVTKVNPLQWTTANASLMVLAVRAASSWLFDPAKLNGQPVPSQMNLTFKVNDSSAH